MSGPRSAGGRELTRDCRLPFSPRIHHLDSMIKRLAHLCFRTDQLDRMIPFYRDILGLPIKFTLTNRDGQEFGCYFACGDRSFLELFDQQGAVRQWGGEVVTLQSPPGTFYQHFCLEVERIEAFRENLVARRVSVTDIAVGMDGSKQCWIRDPDGNSIELMEYTGASLQTKGT
ncbi:MAG TPA: VOC family protein [Opitutaceae bacterium]|nr:VOC family protein [Opitutaceae bacterium]